MDPFRSYDVLNFCQLFRHRKTSIGIFRLSERFLWSSTLTELKINVPTFADYLCLLQGRLPYLSKLIINVEEFTSKHPQFHLIKVRRISMIIFMNNKIFFHIDRINFRDWNVFHWHWTIMMIILFHYFVEWEILKN